MRRPTKKRTCQRVRLMLWTWFVWRRIDLDDTEIDGPVSLFERQKTTRMDAIDSSEVTRLQRSLSNDDDNDDDNDDSSSSVARS